MRTFRMRRRYAWGLLVAGLLWTTFPLYWMLVTSLKPVADMFMPLPSLWPSRVTLANYVDLLANTGFVTFVRNSLAVGLVAMVSSVMISTLAAYSITRLPLPGRQGGGVSGVEVALWDLAGKAYGVPVYQLLGGKFRDGVRLYCDTDAHGKGDGRAMGQALKARLAKGFTFLKMDLGASLLFDVEGALSAPLGFLDQFKAAWRTAETRQASPQPQSAERRREEEVLHIPHPFAGLQLT